MFDEVVKTKFISFPSQMNSFLQPLRGILKSGLTKVCFIQLFAVALYLHHNTRCYIYYKRTPQLSTLMFWTEIFVTEWNARKVSTLDEIRNATIATMPVHART